MCSVWFDVCKRTLSLFLSLSLSLSHTHTHTLHCFWPFPSSSSSLSLSLFLSIDQLIDRGISRPRALSETVSFSLWREFQQNHPRRWPPTSFFLHRDCCWETSYGLPFVPSWSALVARFATHAAGQCCRPVTPCHFFSLPLCRRSVAIFSQSWGSIFLMRWNSTKLQDASRTPESLVTPSHYSYTSLSLFLSLSLSLSLSFSLSRPWPINKSHTHV